MEQKTIEYSERTIDFLKSWGITVEENEKNIARIEKGELIEIIIGCDSNLRNMMNCYDEHKEYHRKNTMLSICNICNDALVKLEVENVYVKNSIRYFVNTQMMNEEIEIRKKIVTVEKNMKKRQAEEKEKNIKDEQGNRIIVSVERNNETGEWRILGGDNYTRLERSVFFEALADMRLAFAKNTSDQILSSAIQPEKSKFFALLTEKFAFRIDNEVFEE